MSSDEEDDSILTMKKCERCLFSNVVKFKPAKSLKTAERWIAVCEEIETNQIPIPDYLKPSHSVTKALFLYPKDGYILCGGCRTFLKKYIKEYEKRISEYFDSLIDIKEPAE